MSDHSLPTCLNCGYVLRGLVEPRCPECGKEFDPRYVEQFEARRLLLPWERTELGGVVNRTLKTSWLACIHSRRYFTALNQRQDQPIHRSGTFIISCMIASVLIHVIGLLLNSLWTLAYFSFRTGSLMRGLKSAGEIRYYSVNTDWFGPTLNVSSNLKTVLLMALLVFFLVRKKRGTFGFVDYSAMFAPIILASAATLSLVLLICIIHFRLLPYLVHFSVWIPILLFAIMTWNCARILMNKSRAVAAGLCLVCIALDYYSIWPLNYVLHPLLQAVTGTG